jgi:circadian clock protein KaiB
MKKPKAVKPHAEEAPTAPPMFRLRLYVSGANQRSKQAIQNIKAIGETHLHGSYQLEVIDAYQQAEMVNEQQVIVLPTLIKSLPPPLRRLVGDLSDEEQVLIGLGLQPEHDDDANHA